ncbi:P-II family nitrogen regulator [Ruminococcus sp. CLA-AA-H200]|uniref:P-II family nitrogen regulator n=1 Tax=Ruminococcus turbiniformis TaxID=2881258 RepID=A0ABS8FYV8_9FIRM|nr:P-II family nitrogen regulator [Ruminococcus turbiniformis]MCC2254347.1 P-II family nitrogen regulator [Ruminococcus turbiniformis]
MSEIYLMMTISKRSVAKRILMCYEQNGLPSVLCTLAQGTATSETLDYFGLEVTEKTVMLAVVTDNTWKTVKRELEDRFQIDVPGTGIAFLMPLSSIGGKKVMQFLLDGQVYEKEEESVMKNTKYELIVVIANHGYTEEVMDAARAQGAGGGTSIHAMGTGLERAEKFLGVSIADEKEIIFIVTKTEMKNAIMKSIMENAGLESKAKSVVFSIPVTDTAGLRLQEVQ